MSANVSEATRLGAIAIEAAVRQAGADKAAVDEAYLGVAVQAGLGQAPARQAVIYAGLPVHVVSTTINKVYSFLLFASISRCTYQISSFLVLGCFQGQ